MNVSTAAIAILGAVAGGTAAAQDHCSEWTTRDFFRTAPRVSPALSAATLAEWLGYN